MRYALIALIPAAALAAPIVRPQPQPKVEASLATKRQLVDFLGGDFNGFGRRSFNDVVSSFGTGTIDATNIPFDNSSVEDQADATNSTSDTDGTEDPTADPGEDNTDTPQDTSSVANPSASQDPAANPTATQAPATDTGAPPAPANNGTNQDDGNDIQNGIESLGSILAQLLGGGNIGDVLKGALGNVIGNLIGGDDGKAIGEAINDGQ